MKKIIFPFVILLLFLGYYYLLYDYRYVSNDNYELTIDNLIKEREKLFHLTEDLRDIVGIKNLDDFKEVVEKDTQIVSYVFSEKRNHYKNFYFYFDSLQNVELIQSDFRIGYTDLDADSVSNYSPILSYIFSQSDYKIQYNDLAWLVCITILSILILINYILSYFKKSIQYLSTNIFTLIIILLINNLQLILGYRYFLLDQSYWMNATTNPISKLTLYKFLGIISHFQSLISDINIASIVLLLVTVIIYFSKTKETV